MMAFADEMVNRKAVGLSGENISREEAERKVREFLAAIGLETLVPLKKEKIYEKVRIPSYTFSVKS